MVERTWDHAPAGSLPGLLQRGRGLGARMAAEEPAAAELVCGCIRWEWRWDERVDHRALYLARLLRDLALPLGPVAELLAAGEGPRRRAAAVLGLLALGGDGPAQEARRALDGVAGSGEHPAGEAGRRSRRTPVHPVPAVRRDAVGTPAGTPGDEPDGVGRLVAELERCWVAQEWCGPDGPARELARHGAGAAGAVSLLRRFWLWTPHSSERAAYLEALAAVGPAGLGEVYTECLWDCEAPSRMLAVRRAPDTPEVRERLAYLRDDPLEDPAVRAAAGERSAAAPTR
ncbi:hypothetical protein ACWGB8_05070 [Kitasatospora sp. NPDC054939]